MYDPAFTKKTLYRELRKSDFKKFPELYTPINIEKAVIASYSKSATGFNATLQVVKNQINKKPVFKIKELPDDLLLRKINSNLKRLTRVKQSDRDTIVYNLIRLLEENVTYKVYKLDIKNFYESISTSKIITKLKSDLAVSRETIRVLESLLNTFQSIGVAGVPRGLQLSATLSEYIMRDFDNSVRKMDNVFFYSRFVDDIIIITSSSENSEEFVKDLSKLLFHGLKFNESKKGIYPVEKTDTHNINTLNAEFVFLGYSYKVINPSNKKHKRRIVVDIAPKKVNKIKTRIARAFQSYIINKDYSLLLDRLKLLTGNYVIFDEGRQVKRKAGIYFSYKHTTLKESASLKELDAFLRKIVLSNSGELFTQVHAALSTKRKREILKKTFTRGFEHRVFHHFHPLKIERIMGCWVYG